jgi:prophage regulatory protein
MHKNLRRPDRIMSAAERRKLVPYSDMHIWRLERGGKFPKRVRVGANRVGWSEAEVMFWIEARKTERATAHA